jgi:hypothetical protein
MSRPAHLHPLFAIALVTLLIGACNYGPAAIKPPSIDPDGSAEQAMEMYDANGDGRIAADELEKAPGLKAALKRMDSNADQAVDADEIASRIRIWQGTRLGVLPLGLTVIFDGRALEGATVTLEPESFLGSDIKASIATTDEFGGSGPSVPKEQRPDPERTPSGVQLGLYRVKISKVVGGKELIPSKFNVNTTLGQEIAPDVPELASMRLKYVLSSK